MEETLGKRIAANRKRMGMTQDRLAEQLGVTAQAVSKWENDQSCPDITILPKLAEIFGITTDMLLGVEVLQDVRDGEIICDPEQLREPDDECGNGRWEFKWDSGRSSGIGFSLWILLSSGLLMASGILGWGAGFWDILWPSGILVFGLWGLLPRFSFFRLGCALFGGYFLLNNLIPDLVPLRKEYLLPVFLLLFGLSLLAEALRKDKKPGFQVLHNGQPVYIKHGNGQKNHCAYHTDGESFQCDLSFGKDRQIIQLPRLSSGTAEVNFGELTIDLSGCEEIVSGCHIDADCSFGALRILVPSRCRVEPHSSTAFGSVTTDGYPAPNAGTVLHIHCDVSFGEITLCYI